MDAPQSLIADGLSTPAEHRGHAELPGAGPTRAPDGVPRSGEAALHDPVRHRAKALGVIIGTSLGLSAALAIVLARAPACAPDTP
ncbi:hypothetical protein [Streptomyces sp. 8N706]|uniref:hypothetical protein n=1 Tax=Streptomyces sp. 8N706 TaxID=3457416 RepID=UPI003FD22FBD